jgi:putative flippase GtrA
MMRQLARFLFTGAANTVATFVLYELLLLFLRYRAAFTIAFACGIAFAALMNSRYVFESALSLRRVAVFAGFYVFSYLLSLEVLVLFVNRLGVHQVLAPVFVVLVMVPVNFAGARLTLVRRDMGVVPKASKSV